MAVYTVSLKTTDAVARKRLRMAVSGASLSVQEKGDAFLTSMDDPGNRSKLETALAEFNASAAPLIALCDGTPLDLGAILMRGSSPPIPPPSMEQSQRLPSLPTSATGQPVYTTVAAPPPPPITTSVGSSAAPALSSFPTVQAAQTAAEEQAQHIAILQQILAPKPATVQMLCFMNQVPSPPFQLEDYTLIRRIISNKGSKMDLRDAGPQRVRFHIRERGYQISTDRSLPPDRRFVLYQTLPSGEAIRIAEGSDPKAVAWAIAIFEQSITGEPGWEERLGRIHGASINGVPPGSRREP